jgi:hypothetical protein
MDVWNLILNKSINWYNLLILLSKYYVLIQLHQILNMNRIAWYYNHFPSLNVQNHQTD